MLGQWDVGEGQIPEYVEFPFLPSVEFHVFFYSDVTLVKSLRCVFFAKIRVGGDGFKGFLFSPLPGEMIQFD